ncbi:hypothetical protein PS1_043254 [Malus domestica]
MIRPQIDENDDLFSSPSFFGNPSPSDLRKFSLLDQTRTDILTPSAPKLFPDSSSSSSEDEDNSNASARNCSYSLPKFVASGGGTVIFKVLIRATVHPNRPTRLEVRPHPLRETQIRCFLQTMVSTASQSWVGTECAVRGCSLSDLYSTAGQGESGDEEAVPYRESVCTSTMICLVGDEGNKVGWSGHRDGMIRCWKMDSAPTPTNLFKEGLSWQAHRGPILSIVISCYGDLWSGSEGCSIKIWPREALEKALSLTAEERHTSSLLVERSYIEPWT